MHHGTELTVIAIVSLILVMGAGARVLSQRIKFPYTVLMLLVGAGVGTFLRLSQAAGPALSHLHQSPISADLVIFVFLPALVFESAFALDTHAFRKNVGFVLVFAGPALLLATGLSAAWMIFVTQGTWQWSWPSALVFAALISATDPVAVVAILREVGAPKRLGLLIEGESLLNDGTAIVVFTVLLGMWASGGPLEVGESLRHFLWVVAGGIGVGLLVGGATLSWLDRTFNDPMVEITLTLIAAYASMLLAEALLHVSGVLAIVTTGILLAGPGRTRISPEVTHFLHEFWEMLAYVANTLIFFLVGVLVAANLGTATASTLGIAALAYLGIVLIRFTIVFASLPLANRMVRHPVDRARATVMAWGGLRGAVSLALALIVSQRADLDPEIRQQILQVTVLVVLATIVINGTSTGWLLRRLKLTQVGPSEAVEVLSAQRAALSAVHASASLAAKAPALHALPWTAALDTLGERRAGLEAELARANQRLASAGPNEQAENLWRYALHIERRFYRQEFERGTLGVVALGRLEHELDVHADLIESGDLDCMPRRRPGIGEGALDRLLRRSGFAFGRSAFRRMSVRYDLARARAGAAAAVEQALTERADEFPGEVLRPLRRAYLDFRAQAQSTLEDMRVNLPEVAEAIERRLVSQVLLSFEERAYKSLEREGRLNEHAAFTTYQELRARAKALHYHVTKIALRETAELCGDAELFQGLDSQTLERIAEITIEQAFAPGEWLFHQGERGESMYIVARGAVEVIDESVDPAERLATLGGGDVLGEMCLLSHERRNAGARALTTVTVGRVRQEDFEAVLIEHPSLRDAVWLAFAQRRLENSLRADASANEMSASRRAEEVAGAHLVQLAASGAYTPRGRALLVAGSVITDAGKTLQGGMWLAKDAPITAIVASRLMELPE